MATDGWSWSPKDVFRDITLNTANASKDNLAKPRSHTVPGLQRIGDENALPPSVAAPKTSGAASAPKKRKSDALDEEKDEMFPATLDDIDDDDPRLANITETCNAVRRKIRNWTESGAMKVGEFQNAFGVSSPAYSSFMNRTGTWDGDGCDTYWKAAVFFKKRELLGLPLKAAKDRKKKTKLTPSGSAGDAATSAPSTRNAVAALLDVSGVDLVGDEDSRVPVFDTCDTVRTKIRAFIARDGITRAALVRALSSLVPAESRVSDANLRYFLGLKGPTSGNTTTVFYAAYLFFEKRRVKDGKPKSKLRLRWRMCMTGREWILSIPPMLLMPARLDTGHI